MRALHPTAKIIGTIRLKRDGGLWEDFNHERIKTGGLFCADVVPLWIDLEQFALVQEGLLLKIWHSVGSSVFISMHDFFVPSSKKLESLAHDARKYGACGDRSGGNESISWGFVSAL